MPRPLPSNIPARGLTPTQAAMYVGLSVRAFDELVRKGVYPGPLPGGTYDRIALDAALDRLSGLTRPSQTDWGAEGRRRIHEGRHEVRHATPK